jgi:hypothetical protein
MAKAAKPAGTDAKEYSATLQDEHRGGYMNSKGVLVHSAHDPSGRYASEGAAAAAMEAAGAATEAAASKTTTPPTPVVRSASDAASIDTAMLAQAEGLLAKKQVEMAAELESRKKEYGISRAETEARAFAKQHNVEL